MKRLVFILFVLFSCVLFATLPVQAQIADSVIAARQASRFVQTVQQKSERFNSKLEKHTQKALSKMVRTEQKLQRKMMRIDPSVSQKLFNYSIDSLKKLQWLMKNPALLGKAKMSGRYFPYLDTLKQSVNFLKNVKSLITFRNDSTKHIGQMDNPTEGIEGRLMVVDRVNEFMEQRNSVLRGQLKTFPKLAKNIAKLQRDAYYYKAQIDEYKNILSDNSKIEQIVTAALMKLPEFGQYFNAHSDLASIFSLRAVGPGINQSIPIVNGIAPRTAVQQAINTNAPASSINLNSLLSQQLGPAETLKDKLKNKLNEAGGMEDKEMPDFKPNNQKVKSFWQRIEYSADLQTTKSNNLFPAIGNLGLQIGYKLNDKSTAGLGAAYRFGLGNGWKNIRLSHQGVGLRSFVNWKLKGKFYIQGGSEWNYNTAFETLRQLKVEGMWQQTALLGLTKKYQFTKKIKGNMQVLYDFLYSRHKPTTPPVLFRLGYGL